MDVMWILCDGGESENPLGHVKKILIKKILLTKTILWSDQQLFTARLRLHRFLWHYCVVLTVIFCKSGKLIAFYYLLHDLYNVIF